MKPVLFMLILGVFSILALNFIYFFDWLNLIGRLVKLFAPYKVIAEIENNKKIRNSSEYKTHKKRWHRIFLIQPAIFSVTALIIAIIFKNTILAFFIGLIVAGITYSFLGKKEANERRIIEKSIKEET